MKRSTKAVLWSALVFPGLGHLYLRRYLRGGLLALCAATAIYFIASTAVHTALQVVEEMEVGGVPLDAESVTEWVSRKSRGTESLTDTASTAFLALWLIGIGDAYRLGRARERAEEREEEPAA